MAVGGGASVYQAGGQLGQMGNASISGGASQIANLLKQFSAQQNFGALDAEANRNIGLAQGNVNNLFQNQMKGFHENVGGGLMSQLRAQKANLQKRGLGGAAALLGDGGAGRQYDSVMSRLKDTWYANGLQQMTGFRKQRQRVADSGSARLTNLMAQLSGLSSGMISANTPRDQYMYGNV